MGNVNGSFLDKNGLTYLWGKLKTLLAGKADASSTVSNVAWDSTNKKITKTINSSTTDVVTASTLKSAMELKFSDIGNTPTTLLGYGIDDAKITSGTITLGSNSITPLVSNDVYGRGTAIPATKANNVDLDSYLSVSMVGRYYSPSYTITSYITNKPYSGAGFDMTVEYMGGTGANGVIVQTVYPAYASTQNVRFFRRIANLATPQEKTGWIEFNSSSVIRADAVLDALDTGVVLTTDSQIDDITTGGSYSCNANDVAVAMNTYQRNNSLELLPFIGRFKLMVFGLSGAGTNSARAVQMFIPNTTSASMYLRVRNGSEWCAWSKVETAGSARTNIADNTDLLDLTPGRYYRTSKTNFITITHRPSDLPAGRFYLDVDNTTALAMRSMKLYPLEPDETGYYYIRNETVDGWEGWYKYTGTAVSDAAT